MTRWQARRPVGWLRETSRWPRRYLLYRRIHPLWLVLSRALPNICLDPPPRPERDYHLPVRGSYAALYRRVIEVHDGLADMRAYADPEVADVAALGALACGLDPSRAAAIGAGVRLEVAVQAHAAGATPQPPQPAAEVPATPPRIEMNVDEEARWLTHVALAYRRAHGHGPRTPRRPSTRRRRRILSSAAPHSCPAPTQNRRAS